MASLHQPVESPLQRMAIGSAWMIAARWGARGIGLVSTIVLARLLSPGDFGLVAMCSLLVAFLRVLTDAGQDMAVIRHADPTPEHFDTAWSMSVCMGLAAAVVLLACGPFAGWYFRDPRTVPLLAFLAFAPLIDGFTNIGVIAGFRRDLQFDREFRFLLLRKFSGFAIALPLALILRNYWALAGGIVLGRLATVASSYWMHPYRPRFRMTKLRELWSYSAWMQIAGIAQYFGMEGDQLIVGRLVGAAMMGDYNVGVDLAAAPTNEITLPMARALFPVYAKLLDEPARLVRSYLDVLSIVGIVGLSTGVGVALVAHDLVVAVLGPKWLAAVPLVPWLAIAAGVYGVTRSVYGVLSVTGHARVNAVRNVAFAVLLIPASIAAGLRWGGEGVAAARAVITVLFTPVMFYSLMRVLPITAGQIFEHLWRPAVAAAVMAAVVLSAGTEADFAAPMRLFCNVGLGALTFATILLVLWRLAGCPQGPERLAVEKVRRALSPTPAVAADRPRPATRRD